MGVGNRLRKWALARPGVLIIDAPGNNDLRWLVESDIDRRGWHQAPSPADAALLLTIGTLPGALCAAADIIWSQIPQPRHRQAIGPVDVSAQLDGALAVLATPSAYQQNHLDPATQLSRTRDEGHGMSHGDRDVGDDSDDSDDSDTGGDDDGAHDTSDDGDTGGDHGDHNMSGDDMDGQMHSDGDVAGLAMAGTAPDRDGLELDELKITLGPVLPGWPTGLLLKASLQGDVMTGVSLTWVDGVFPADQHSGSGSAVLALDALARFLLVAGWPLLARRARNARSALSSGNATDTARGKRIAADVARRIRGSRFLSWSVRGMGDDDNGSSRNPHLAAAEGHPSGDVLDRVRALAAFAIQDETQDGTQITKVEPEHIEFLLEGAELAAARLIVASFVFDPVSAIRRNGSGRG